MKPKQNVVQKGAIKFKSGIKNEKFKEELSNQRKSEALIMHLKGIKVIYLCNLIP